jgi:solute carrier family 25 citrate transporter 1
MLQSLVSAHPAYLLARAPGVPVCYAPMGGGNGKKRHPLKAIVAGGLAGAIEACISYPTEYIKTQLQLFDKKMSPLQCARETIRNDGVLGLYRGLSSLLFFSVPKVSSRFFAFETLSNLAKGPDGKMSTLQTLGCGIGAGTCEAIVAVTPMDTIKTRLIHDQLTAATPADRKYKGFFHGVRTIVGEYGMGGVYKGLTATILKQSSNQAIRWVVFLNAKEAMAKEWTGGDVSKLGILHTTIASVAAGAASVYGNTPIDVIKTRMQGLAAKQYANTWDCAKQIMVNEGPRAFYKGATARLARVCLDVSVVSPACLQGFGGLVRPLFHAHTHTLSHSHLLLPPHPPFCFTHTPTRPHRL